MPGFGKRGQVFDVVRLQALAPWFIGKRVLHRCRLDHIAALNVVNVIEKLTEMAFLNGELSSDAPR
jgi:hypothetical protein